MGAALKLYDHRNGRGQFAQGNISNPGGRPRATPEEREAKRLLREGSIRAAKKLLKLIDSDDERMAFAASTAVLGYSEVARVESEDPPSISLEMADELEAAARKIREQAGK